LALARIEVAEEAERDVLLKVRGDGLWCKRRDPIGYAGG